MSQQPNQLPADGIQCPMCSGAFKFISECRCFSCVANGSVFATGCKCGFAYTPVGVWKIDDFKKRFTSRPLQLDRLAPSTN